MINLHENVNSFINDLLHIQDVKTNKLLDVYAGNAESTFLLKNDILADFSAHVLSVIKDKIGRTATTVLKNSSLTAKSEQIVGQNVNAFDWENALGEQNADYLQKNFITGAYKDLAQKGTNPLYLTVGAIKWQLEISKNEIKNVTSPLIIFPIRLIRADASNTPVYIEFINDDIYLNPCLIAKLNQVYGGRVTENFPHPNQLEKDLSVSIDIDALQNGEEYFARLNEHLENCYKNDENENKLFILDKDFVSIISYNHDEICMYYDIQRNKEKIYTDPLVNRIFNKTTNGFSGQPLTTIPQYVMPKDSVQEDIIKKVVNGESLIIKGPPGTGKTLTITNMVASLLAENKKVLLCSKKLGALAEINAKLPEELRKFTMLLDSESEAQTAKLNPSEARSDFMALLNGKKNYQPPLDLLKKISLVKKRMLNSANVLKEHKRFVFEEKDILGKCYFEVLNILLDKRIKPIEFISGELAFSVSEDLFNAITELVRKAEFAFNKITEKTAFEKCPFVPLSKSFRGVDTEKVLSLNKQICLEIEDLLTIAKQPSFANNIPFDQMDIVSLSQILSGEVNEKLLSDIIDSESIGTPAFNFLTQSLADYLLEENASQNLSIINPSIVEEWFSALSFEGVDKSLTNQEFFEIYNNYEVVKTLQNSVKLAQLKDYIINLNAVIEEKETLDDEFYSIFRKDINSQEIGLVAKAVKVLEKYFDKDLQKPKLLDFKSKSIVKKLSAFGYGKTLSFEKIVYAVKLYSVQQQNLLNIEEIKVKISSLLKTKLTKEQLSAIILVMQKAEAKKVSFERYSIDFSKYSLAVTKLLGAVNSQRSFTLNELYIKCKHHFALNTLLNAVLSLDASATEQTAVKKAKNIVTAGIIINNGLLGKDKESIVQNANKLLLHGEKLKTHTNNLLSLFKKFQNECFSSYYACTFSRPTFSDLKLFLDSALDRNLLGAVNDYLTVLKTPCALPLSQFFTPFEKGLRGLNHSIEDIFTHSIYSLAVSHKLSLLGAKRNGVGEKIANAFTEFYQLEIEEQRLTAQNVERLCMSRINEKDSEFNFLNTAKSFGETLRLFFKKNAEGIIKLKKCFLLSPSTTSILLTHPAFFNFDVVICDEASQLEPTALLPLLIRANQIVLVGDEWQMPPIKRGVAKLEKRIDEGDGDYTLLSPDVSALSLALTNCSLPTEKLVCHYRSKTESLIAFSQKRFYPFMKTFPAVEPKKQSVGLNDIYIENGLCEGGENFAEAEQAVCLIKEHFRKHYNEKDKTLSSSIGIVGFGEKQIKLILSLVNKDRDLCDKIESAKRNFEDDVKEKLIFFKPIDKVQGQETEHLILSLTYGKNKTGKVVNAFGELNRGNSTDKLGQCIFNVAVTRAKSSVTVIRSINYYDITQDSVLYISEYLKEVDRFKTCGREQFIGDKTDTAFGFAKDVATFLIEQGIDKDRIVLNYGGTEGSIKIPLVILNKDQTRADLALWLERPTNGGENYFDYNLKYYEILKDRGWNFIRIFIHDWFDNEHTEKQKLISAIKSLI